MIAAARHTGKATKAAARRHRQRRRAEPYTWLGVGALSLGIGAAMATGSGVAYADSGPDGGGSSPDGTASGSSAGKSPSGHTGRQLRSKPGAPASRKSGSKVPESGSTLTSSTGIPSAASNT